MGYMEIAILSQDSIRVKGKSSSIVINPQNKSVPLQAAILIGVQQGKNFNPEEGIVIDGPGEYEIGGVKISGMRGKDEVVYSMTVDGVAIALGTLTALSAAQQKIKEHNIVVSLTMTEMEAAFVTSIAVNSVLFYGPVADKVVSNFAKEGVKEMSKYSTTLDKLPQEMETVLLK
jgi:hypothetical protein